MNYSMEITKEGGRYLVSFPDFPEAHTFGETREEAKARAKDALQTIIDFYMRERRPLPTPTAAKFTVTLPAIVAAKIGLYRALLDSKTTKYALAKRLKWHTPQVDRLFDVRHQSKLEQIEQAAAALGRRVKVEMEPADTHA